MPTPPPTGEQQITKSKMRNWIATGITLAVLLAIGLFTYRIVYFVNLINSGELRIEDLRFGQARTLSSALAAAPVPDGEFDVASEDDPRLGNADARVEIIEFADFGCPFSRKSSFVIRALAQKYGDRISYQYRDFPIVEIHPHAQLAAEAGECARLQDKFWEYHDKLYLNQFDHSRDRLITYAKEINMDTNAFAKCLDGGIFKQEVLEDYADGVEAGVRGTPTFFINGNRIPGSIPERDLEAIIENVLNQ